MLETIGEFRIDPNDFGLVSLTQSEPFQTNDALIQDSLRVSCVRRSGEMLEVSAMRPNNLAPFYRVNPVNMGASEWYSIEYAPSIRNVSDSSRIVAVLDAASMQSVSVFAILRAFYTDGRSEDISSRQLEIRKDRKKWAFAFDVDDVGRFPTNDIEYYRLIFLIEARNVAVDIYGLTITSVKTANAQRSLNDKTRIRLTENAMTSSRLKRALGPRSRRIWKGETTKHRALTKNTFIDFEPGSGQQTSVTRHDNHLILDFSKATGRWRTLEFRFDEVKNSGTAFALVHFEGMSLSESPLEVALVLREYGDGSAWSDVPVPFSFTLNPENTAVQHLIDLSSLLNSDRDHHQFGIFMFFPLETDSVAIKELEVSIFDIPFAHG